jgi:hypothetical protein
MSRPSILPRSATSGGRFGTLETPLGAIPAGCAFPPAPHGDSAEVNAVDLSFAIGGTSANSNTAQPLDENADQAAIIAKLNELIQALRR